MTYPKIELHVHLEGTVLPTTLLRIARRNDVPMPVSKAVELERLFKFRDFAHFIEVYRLCVSALRSAADFREILVDYAREAKSHGAHYLEVIVSPTHAKRNGVSFQEFFEGYCDGLQQAQEEVGLVVRLTPDISRQYGLEEAEEVVKHSVRHRDRGVVGVGLGGLEVEFPPEDFAHLFARVKEEGLGSVPHAGELGGPGSIRSAIETLQANRLRHGIRAAEDPGLLREIRDRRIVLDVCPISNLRTRAVGSLREHPLPRLLEAGILCTINTDDPAMFDTNLGFEHEIAQSLGAEPAEAFRAGIAGCLADPEIVVDLSSIHRTYQWADGAGSSV